MIFSITAKERLLRNIERIDSNLTCFEGLSHGEVEAITVKNTKLNGKLSSNSLKIEKPIINNKISRSHFKTIEVDETKHSSSDKGKSRVSSVFYCIKVALLISFLFVLIIILYMLRFVYTYNKTLYLAKA